MVSADQRGGEWSRSISEAGSGRDQIRAGSAWGRQDRPADFGGRDSLPLISRGAASSLTSDACVSSSTDCVSPVFAADDPVLASSSAPADLAGCGGQDDFAKACLLSKHVGVEMLLVACRQASWEGAPAGARMLLEAVQALSQVVRVQGETICRLRSEETMHQLQQSQTTCASGDTEAASAASGAPACGRVYSRSCGAAGGGDRGGAGGTETKGLNNVGNAGLDYDIGGVRGLGAPGDMPNMSQHMSQDPAHLLLSAHLQTAQSTVQAHSTQRSIQNTSQAHTHLPSSAWPAHGQLLSSAPIMMMMLERQLAAERALRGEVGPPASLMELLHTQSPLHLTPEQRLQTLTAFLDRSQPTSRESSSGSAARQGVAGAAGIGGGRERAGKEKGGPDRAKGGGERGGKVWGEKGGKECNDPILLARRAGSWGGGEGEGLTRGEGEGLLPPHLVALSHLSLSQTSSALGNAVASTPSPPLLGHAQGSEVERGKARDLDGEGEGEGGAAGGRGGNGGEVVTEPSSAENSTPSASSGATRPPQHLLEMGDHVLWRLWRATFKGRSIRTLCSSCTRPLTFQEFFLSGHELASWPAWLAVNICYEASRTCRASPFTLCLAPRQTQQPPTTTQSVLCFVTTKHSLSLPRDSFAFCNWTCTWARPVN